MEHLITFESYQLGREEFVEIINPETGESKVLRAKIDTETYTSNIDYNLALELGLVISGEKRVYNIYGDNNLKTANINLVFSLGDMTDMTGNRIETEVTIADRGKLRNQLAIGRKDIEKLGLPIDVRKKL